VKQGVKCNAELFTTSQMCVPVRSDTCSSQFISKIRSDHGRKVMALNEIDYWINFHACHANVLRVWPELRKPQFGVIKVFLDFLTPTQTVLHRTINHVGFISHKVGV
jgi:hypothetical protein